LQLSPTATVISDGNCYIGQPHAGAFYTNSELFGDFEDYIVYDLVGFIDSAIRTVPIADMRGVMGHSCGGYGCMKIALKHPDIFGAVASHGGTPDLNVGLSVWRPLVLAENGGTPPYNYSPYAGVFTISMFGWAGAFTPNLSNPPYYVDFPLDRQGDIIDTVVARWAPHDPVRLAAELPSNHGLSIYFDCGIFDEYECLPMNQAFAESLTTFGVPYVYYEYPGNHFNMLPDRFYEAFLFFDSVMSAPVGVIEDDIIPPREYILSQNYPNPFNAGTTIKYFLEKEGTVTIRVYDIMGRRIKTLVNAIQNTGEHSVSWDAENYSSGTYFYRIIAGEYSETRKMTLVK
jgi:pimeloyl-ACP methyl ester carboxylesterase